MLLGKRILLMTQAEIMRTIFVFVIKKSPVYLLSYARMLHFYATQEQIRVEYL